MAAPYRSPRAHKPRAQIETRRLCVQCRTRYRQYGELCQPCAHAAGLYTTSTIDADPVPVPVAPAPACIVTRIVDGVEYEVKTIDQIQKGLTELYPNRGSSLSQAYYDRPRAYTAYRAARS